MPINLSEFLDWKSQSYALRVYGDDLHILDKWMNIVVRLNVMVPKQAAVEILHTFGFKKEETK